MAALAEQASPLNTPREFVGMDDNSMYALRQRQKALEALARGIGHESHDATRGELNQFDERLDRCLSARPVLALSARRGLPWSLPPPLNTVLTLASMRADENQSKSKSGRPSPTRSSLIASFKLIDKNGNGSLSRAEVVKACRSDASVRALLGLPADINEADGSKDQLLQVFERMDADASKTIDIDEFCAAFLPAGGQGGAA
jgi:hypothetical protein